MNRRNQNFTAPENWRSSREEEHHGMMHLNLMGTRNNRTNFQSIPRPFPPNPREVVLEPWGLFQERSISGPLAIPPSYPEQRRYYSDNHQIIYLDNQRRPPPSFFPEPSSSTSSPTTQQAGRWVNAHSPEDESKLTQDEQKQALNKLKKEVYFPLAPKRGRRPNLYFREHYNSINSMGNKNHDEDEDGKRCAVCLDDFEAREVVMVTPCNHMFHEDCIIPWVKSQGRCPVCRYAICERFKENAAPITSNIIEPYEVELISIIRAMEDAFMSENMRPFH